MSKIICEWTTCIHNSAPTWTTNNGCCMFEEDLLLTHIDNQNTDVEEDKYIEGLVCNKYKQDNTKPVK